MIRSPWPAVLLLAALAAYLTPQPAQSPLESNFGVQPTPSVSDPLPQDARQLFSRVRRSAVRIEQQGADGSGGLGTGFFISAQGLLLTAYHVVDGAQRIQITTVSGQNFAASVVGFDNAADVALLKIATRGTVPYLKLSAQVPRPGTPVLAVGNSGGDFLQARRGRLLRLGVQAGDVTFPENTLEMSAPLAPGDSGGPIVNSGGEAIGVVSYVRVDSQGNTLRSYAVPVTANEQLIGELKAGTKRDVPAVGIGFNSEYDGQTDPPGGVVGQVVAGGPGSAAGLRAFQFDRQTGRITQQGDVVTAVDGVRTRRSEDVIFEVRRRKIGETVTLTLSRNGQTRQAQVTLVARGTLNYLR